MCALDGPMLAGTPLVARELRWLRKASPKTSRAALAAELGVDAQDIKDWEKGRPIPAEFVVPLADSFGVSAGWLLGETVDQRYKQWGGS